MNQLLNSSDDHQCRKVKLGCFNNIIQQTADSKLMKQPWFLFVFLFIVQKALRKWMYKITAALWNLGP